VEDRDEEANAKAASKVMKRNFELGRTLFSFGVSTFGDTVY